MARWILMIAPAAVALALAGQAPAQPAARRSHARLALTREIPLTVRGAGFHRHERVRVVARAAGTRATRRVRANRSGRFTVSFSGDASPRCGQLRVTASGGRGSHAALTSARLRECAPR